MKAWVLHGINEIRLETVELPALESGQALVAVKAAGICGSDIPRIYRTGAHRHPLIPGHEFSGVVESVGKETDSAWLGKRVGVFPLIPCGACGPCIKGQYEMCRNYGYLGSRRDGGFAEYVAVPAENLIELPDNVSFEEAAMLEPMAVAVHAVRRVIPAGVPGAPGNNEEEAAVVFGLGTIGLLLLALLLEEGRGGRNFDAVTVQQGSVPAGRESGTDAEPEPRRVAGLQSVKRILVVGNKELQKSKACELGLPEADYCDSRIQDAGKWIMEQTQGHGADVVFECVGRNETMTQAVDSAAPSGRICLVGNPASDMVLGKDVYWKILRNQLTVRGTWNSSFTHHQADDWHYALELFSQKRIDISRLISHRFPLAELDRGFCIMRDKSEEYVKIMGQMPLAL